MSNMPTTLVADHRTEVYTEESMPDEIRSSQGIEANTWAMVRVLKGRIILRTHGDDAREEDLSPAAPGIIEPQVPHELEPEGAVEFYVQYFREPGA